MCECVCVRVSVCLCIRERRTDTRALVRTGPGQKVVFALVSAHPAHLSTSFCPRPPFLFQHLVILGHSRASPLTPSSSSPSPMLCLKQNFSNVIPVHCLQRNDSDEGVLRRELMKGGGEGGEALRQRCRARGLWPTVLPLPWAALGHGSLWPPPCLSLWQGSLGNSSYWETKRKQPGLSLGPRTGGADASSCARPACRDLSRGRGLGATGQTWASQG